MIVAKSPSRLLKNMSLTERVEEDLIKFLTKNKFIKGDLLPKETEIAEQLDVSRNALREALSRLRMLGIIVSKKKKGMQMGEPDLLSGMTRIMDPALLGNDNLDDLFELRLVLEVGMADLLFSRKTDKDIEALQNIALKEKNDIKCANSLKRRLKYEIQFHGKLYSMTGNKTLARFQKMLLPIFNHMMELESSLDIEPPRGNITHFDLIEALINGNASKFRKNMREHLTPHFSRL